MLKLGLISCLILMAAGCATEPRYGPAVPPDWSATGEHVAEQTEAVPEGPVIAPPPAAIPGPQSTFSKDGNAKWVSLARWARDNHLGTLRRISPEPDSVYELAASTGVLRIQINSLVARWRGVELHLGFQPELINGQPFLHALDLEKNIEPLLKPFPIPAGSNRVIVLDPGHGGENRGTQSVLDGSLEKNFTLDWARRLQPLLAAQGWQVYLTRVNDADVGLSNRVASADAHHADLFVSLHFNSAAPSQEQHGLETYCLTPSGMSSTLTRGYEDDSSAVFPNNAFDTENIELAFLLHRALLPVVGTDRGIRRARFMTVLRGQHCPAVLIEGGYLSNPDEARHIADPSYREKLAEAVAAALNGAANHS